MHMCTDAHRKRCWWREVKREKKTEKLRSGFAGEQQKPHAHTFTEH